MTAAERLPEEPERGRDDAPSDRSLLRRFRGGSQEAATQLYLRYVQRLRRLTQAELAADLGARLDVDDIVQSVFGSFFRGARRGDYDVPDGDELWRLFLVIALNKVRAKAAFHRAAKRDVRQTVAGAEGEQALAAAPAGDEALLELIVADVLDRLPEQHRTMVELRLEGHGVAEMAERTGRSKRSVERVLQESRKKLDALLREHT